MRSIILIAVRAHASLGGLSIRGRSLACLAERSSATFAWDGFIDSTGVVPLAHFIASKEKIMIR